MSKIVAAVVFVVVLNGLMFLGQYGINQINPTNPITFFTYAGSTISSYDQGNYTLIDNPNAQLPTQTGSISPTTGNVFTDTWTAVINWFAGLPGINYLLMIVDTVPNFLKAIGLPAPMSFALGFMWYGFSIIIIVAFIKGYYV